MPHITKSLWDAQETEKEDEETHLKFTSSVPEMSPPKPSVQDVF